jgi:hypothetical protein
MTSKEREEQRLLLDHAPQSFTDLRYKWFYVAAGMCLDRILESAAYAWTDGPEDES